MGWLDRWTHPAVKASRGGRALAQTDARLLALDAKSNRAEMLDYAVESAYAFGTNSPKAKDYNTYLKAYRLPWVRACVQVIAYNAANIEFKLLGPTRGDDDQPNEVGNSPFLNLMKQPNPFQTGFELRELLWTDQELTGNAFIALEAKTGRGLPTELYRLSPDRVTVIPDPEKMVAGYRYTANGRAKPITYQADEILHLKYPNPLDHLYGMGVIEAAEGRFDSERAMIEHERRFWQSGAKITGVFKSKEDLKENTFNRLKDSIRKFFDGSGYTTLLLGSGLDYQSVSDSPAKLGLLDMAQASRDQILALFGVPATKLGILERANYKADEADRYFWTETVDPKLTRFEKSIQALIDLFHPGQGYKLSFQRLNFSDDLPQMEVALKMRDVGIFRANEIRGYLGRDPIPDGDVLISGGMVAPVDLAGAMATLNERRLQQGLPPIEGGDEYIILPSRSVPLDVATGQMLQGGQAKPGQPSSGGGTQQQPPDVVRTGAGKAATSSRLPATGHRVTRRREKALKRGLQHKSKLETFFGEQEARILHRLRGFKRQKAAISTESLWGDGDEEDASLLGALDGLYLDAMQEGYGAAADSGLDVAFDLDNPRLQDFRGTLAKRVSDINETTRDALDAQITEGLRRGYSVRQLAEGVPDEDFHGVSGVFGEARGSRAETIARTESLHAFSGASIVAYQQSGVVDMVELMDGTEDEACADRNGRVVPLSQAQEFLKAEHPNGTLALLPVVGG